MKTRQERQHYQVRIHQSLKTSGAKYKLTSVHLLLLAFAIIMVFGAIMKAMHQ